MLEPGKLAPAFSLKDEQGKIRTLEEFRGKNVVLYFYPKDDTPGCTREAIGFTHLKVEFEKQHAIVLGLSKDSVDSHQKFCIKHALDVILLSDPDGKTVEAYDVWKEKNLYGKVSMGIVRTTVLINEEGVISQVWSNVKVDGHAEAVLEAIKAPQ